MYISFGPVTTINGDATGTHRRGTRTSGATAALVIYNQWAAGVWQRELRSFGAATLANTGDGAQRRTIVSLGTAAAPDKIETTATGYAHRQIATAGTAKSGVTGPVPPPPADTPITGWSYRVLTSSGAAAGAQSSSGSAPRVLRSRGFSDSATASDVGGVHTRAVYDYGTPLGDTGAFIAVDFTVDGFASRVFETAAARANAASAVHTVPILRLAASVLGAVTSSTQAHARIALLGHAQTTAQLGAWFLQVLADGAAASDTLTERARYVARIADSLLASGAATSYLDATQQLYSAVAAVASASAFALESMQEHAAATATMEHKLQAIAQLLDAALSQDEATTTLRMTVVLADTAIAADDVDTTLSAVQLLQDGASAAVSLYLDNGQYVAWTYNMQSAGATRYTNYPFNSFAKVGGVYYGMTSTGLYRLDADDDAGVPIAAKIRLGMTDLGTRQLKNTPDVFVGYTGDGQLLLRVIYVDDATGEKTGVDYRLRPRPAGSKRESRFEPGKGLVAVDFDYEIENIGGSDFTITNVEFTPMSVSRRTRG